MNPNMELKLTREVEILQSIDKLSYLSRSQIQRLHGLGSNRNACRVLANMDDFLNSFRAEENVYYLNKNGRERIGSKDIRSKTLQYRHFLMRNDLYIYLKKPSIWENEYNIDINGVKIIPDVMYTKKVLNEDRYFFAEIDNEQIIATNLNKLRKYKQLKDTNVYQKQLGYFPTLSWVVKTERRKVDLLKYGEGLKQEIYLWSEIR